MPKFALSLTAALVAMLTAPSAIAAEYVVRMKFNPDLESVYFDPPRIDIKAGDTVVWILDDSEHDHNVVAYPDGIPEGTNFFESPMLKRKGQKWSMTFAKSGTYRYHCHPPEDRGMAAMVVVDRESRPDEFRKLKPGEHSHRAGSPAHKH
jgi:plastocyanin